jgi:hypothetical protein
MRKLTAPGLVGLLFSAACGETATGPREDTGDLGDDPQEPVVSCQPYTIPWLAEGNFWNVSWSEIEIDVGWTDSYGDHDVGSYVMKLGAPTVVNDKTMYQLLLTGDTRKYAPLWGSIGTDGCGNVFGLTSSSQTPVLIYSETSDEWSGTGYYTNFSGFSSVTVNRNGSIISSQYTTRLPYFNPPLTAVGYSESESSFDPGGCDYFPGYGTICTEASSGPSTGLRYYEYWDHDAGPVGMHYSYDYEDCLGFACNEKHVEQRVEVWFFGDVTSIPIAFENEPDTYADPTPFPVSESLFTMFGEVSEYDTPSGYIPGYDAAVGMDLAAEIHDWFAFEITPVLAGKTVDFYLAWEADVEFGFYLFSAPDNAPYGFTYLAESLDFPEWEETAHARFFSGTYLPGKYMLGVIRETNSEFGTQYGIMSFAGTP